MLRWSAVKRIWNSLLQSLPHNGLKELLALLCQEYVEETRHSIQFQRHAERMDYPEFRSPRSNQTYADAERSPGGLACLDSCISSLQLPPKVHVEKERHLLRTVC